MRTAGFREPDEPRGSRPVLRERGGETPPRHSPNATARERNATHRRPGTQTFDERNPLFHQTPDTGPNI
jgi:hypothetical protein